MRDVPGDNNNNDNTSIQKQSGVWNGLRAKERGRKMQTCACDHRQIKIIGDD